MLAKIRKDHSWEFRTYSGMEEYESRLLYRIVPGYSKEHGHYFDVLDLDENIVKRKRTWESCCHWVITEGGSYLKVKIVGKNKQELSLVNK